MEGAKRSLKLLKKLQQIDFCQKKNEKKKADRLLNLFCSQPRRIAHSQINDSVSLDHQFSCSTGYACPGSQWDQVTPGSRPLSLSLSTCHCLIA